MFRFYALTPLAWVNSIYVIYASIRFVLLSKRQNNHLKAYNSLIGTKRMLLNKNDFYHQCKKINYIL